MKKRGYVNRQNFSDFKQRRQRRINLIALYLGNIAGSHPDQARQIRLGQPSFCSKLFNPFAQVNLCGSIFFCIKGNDKPLVDYGYGVLTDSISLFSALKIDNEFFPCFNESSMTTWAIWLIDAFSRLEWTSFSMIQYPTVLSSYKRGQV